ncbi:hypothetical protein BGZ68_006577 [Mortierella alpina]|nr:hypothetical protein BGZ68_006577 [Mortierella alpina]
MFTTHATHCDTAATTAAAGAGDGNPWFHNDHLLLSPQDDLDYTSFSTDTPLPLLSLDSFSSVQSATAMTSFFPEFAPLSTPGAASGLFPDMSSFHSRAVPLPVKVSDNSNNNNNDTARQAALLHAYLAAQTPPSSAQHQWTFSNSAVNNAQFQQQTYLVEQQQQQQQQQQKEMEVQQQEKEQVEQLMQIQQADALNLARYLAQSQQIKQETSSETAMEHDTVSAPQSPSPCSSSSESGDKSPMGSPTMAGRSLSPEAASPSKCSKPSRQLICFNCKVTQTPLWRRTPDRQHSLCNACGLYYKQYGAHRPLHVRHKLPTVLADVRLNTLPYARPSSAQPHRGHSPGPTSPSEGTLSFSSTSIESSSSSSDSDSDSGRVVASLPDLAKMYTEALIRSPVQKTTPPLMTAKQGIECANCSQTQTPLWRKNDAGEPICNACGLYAKLHHRDRPVTMRKSKITRRRRDWGGNLAHQAQAQAQALALAHAQAQAAAFEGQHPKGLHKGGMVMDQQLQQLNSSSVDVASIVEEMNRKAQELVGHSTSTSAHSSDSEEEHPYKSFSSMQQQQQQQQQQQEHQQQQQVERPASPAPAMVASPPVPVGQNMSNSLILDENKFSDMVGQMNAHQMNRFLSILETRCGVLRERLLASTEATAHQQSDLDHLF